MAFFGCKKNNKFSAPELRVLSELSIPEIAKQTGARGATGTTQVDTWKLATKILISFGT